MMEELTLVQRVVVWSLPVVFAITGHEVAHGWMAKRYGDKTAEREGRLTLNPLRHIDPLGTIIIPGLLLITFTGFIFGWAKPVPIDARNFKQPKKAMMMVALAGPLANLCMAIAWALLARIGVALEFEFVSMPLIYSGVAGITINLVLMMINLLPIPPLDGSRVLSGLLPDYWAWRYNQFERYGFIVLLILLATDVLSFLLAYPMFYAQQLFFTLAGM
ncbi:site-2 protease family protein [Methylomonas sp. MED-D]|uniref:Peptidase n=1 Tax=Methylomonas koyamae TaxID=702114 RepID=A0A177P091_9GAMM|nr:MULTISPECIES: site-2 protease family protein [Methylomonas]NJA04959.1 site-2 protease family protein [Methylococcaceae bacterium WWC4]MDT4331039.1 site-2 protease family protein [Methylomonas sp. MV1]OAI23706.1 peptidase [Methylomonas koyamae]OHX34079.1 site-2 protease family protein [Methylomonas sp. LWB]WGS84809.1 site-2 protease family protein [Methylomonas sp. UP202]